MIKSLLHSYIAKVRYKRDPVGTAREMGVVVGEGCRLRCQLVAFGSEPYLISIGDHVTIASGVRFVTHDGGVWVFRPEDPEIEVFGKIAIGNNVFIGINSIIMPGVTIGSNCVIGAGSVVTRNIPDGSVAVGVPAKIIKSVHEYRESIKPKELHLRSLPAAQKRRAILDALNRSPST